MVLLSARYLGLETGEISVFLNRKDAEKIGVRPHDRVRVVCKQGSLIAVVNIATTIVKEGEVGFGVTALKRRIVQEGEKVEVGPAGAPKSAELIKKKIKGEKLSEEEITIILKDIISGSISDLELASFITALEIRGMTLEEVECLTRKMAELGNKLSFEGRLTFDKHSIGGLAGNSKDTLIIVPIVSAAGLLMPKTSSRAITSPSGSADTMGVIADVDLTAEEAEEVVKKVGACIICTEKAGLSPADGIMIARAMYPLALDPECMMVASILSKKLAASIKRMVLDIPIGKEAKVRSMAEARELANKFRVVGTRLGIAMHVAISYGGQPLGRSIGPALEAAEALKILITGGNGPRSTIGKCLAIAGELLEMGNVAPPGKGREVAREILKSGKAYEKMRQIIEAQSGNPDIKPDDLPIGKHEETIKSPKSGYVTVVSNRALMLIARAAGAPRDKGAGIYIHAKRGDKVEEGGKLYTIYSNSCLLYTSPSPRDRG